MTTIHISQDGHYAGTGRLIQYPDGTVTIEDCSAILGPSGLDHASGEQQAAAERAYEAIEAAIAAGESSVAVDGCVYTWAVEEPPTIKVLGLGDENWDEEPLPQETEEERLQRESRRTWERYGTVRVQVGDVVYEVGCCVGVPEYLRGMAEAVYGGPEYLDVWYITWGDWAFAPASAGRDGIPEDLRDNVLGAIYDARVRLWREYQQERAGED